MCPSGHGQRKRARYAHPSRAKPIQNTAPRLPPKRNAQKRTEQREVGDGEDGPGPGVRARADRGQTDRENQHKKSDLGNRKPGAFHAMTATRARYGNSHATNSGFRNLSLKY